MKETSQYDRRTVYIPSVLPPKMAKPEIKPFTMKDMIEDAKRCNARMRKIVTERAQGYKRKKYPPAVTRITLPDGMKNKKDFTRKDILEIIAKNPGVTALMISSEIKKTRQGVRHHVSNLIKDNLVRWERKNRNDAQRLWVME